MGYKALWEVHTHLDTKDLPLTMVVSHQDTKDPLQQATKANLLIPKAHPHLTIEASLLLIMEAHLLQNIKLLQDTLVDIVSEVSSRDTKIVILVIISEIHCTLFCMHVTYSLHFQTSCMYIFRYHLVSMRKYAFRKEKL